MKINQLYELYKDTLGMCGSFLLKENDEVLEYNVFEEFDIGVVSFLHEDSLIKLFEAGLITENEMLESTQLRDMVLTLQENDEWNIEALRTSDNWKKVMVLADKLNIFQRSVDLR